MHIQRDIAKELFRKSIHLCSAFVPLFAEVYYGPTLIALSLVLALFCIFESLRIHGRNIPLVSAITRFAARNRDGDRFVFGPVTLAVGVILSLILFPTQIAKIAIWAVAFGDGLASLVGKIIGKQHLTLFPDKSIAGSLACLLAVFLASLLAGTTLLSAIILAITATVLEALPLKNFDNIAIPLGTALVAVLIV